MLTWFDFQRVGQACGATFLEPLIDDVQLALRAQQGDHAAFRCLLLRHHDALLYLIRHGFPDDLKSAADVEDVLQVTYAEISERMADFEPLSVEAVGGWFRKIAERNLLDLIRFHRATKRGGKFVRIDQDAGIRQDSDADVLMALVLENSLTPSRAAARNEVMAALEVALEQLPRDYQTVIRHRFLDQLTLQQTADQMHRTEAAVRGLSFRALQSLREIMGRYSRYFSRS